MKSCISGMIIGATLGAIVCSVYPIPMCGKKRRTIKRAVRRVAKNAQSFM